jgi:signal peptidase I
MPSGENADELASSEVQSGPKPRSIASIVLIGVLLGPITVMLWLGRGKLALLYFLLQFMAAAAFFIPAILGLTPSIAIKGFNASETLPLLTFPLSIVAITHAIRLRRSVVRPWFSRWFIALPLPVAVGLVAAFCVRTFLYQPFNIPSGAMMPTLRVGDYLFVSKTAYGYGRYSLPFDLGFNRRSSSHQPERGDIVVFKLPRDNRTDYIKRIISLPGERVQVIDGLPYINGVAIKKEPIGTYDNADEEAYGGINDIPMYRETLPNGVTYDVLDAEPNGLADNTPEYVVPIAHYFMMGDNRDNSLDSRFLKEMGYVPYENLVGQATLIFWNSNGAPIAGRLFEHSPNR